MPALNRYVILTLPFVGFLGFHKHGQEFLVIYEASVSFITFMLLARAISQTAAQYQRRKLFLFAIGMLSVTVAESICGVGFLRHNIGSRGQNGAEVFYLVFWICLIILMRWHYGALNPARSKVVAGLLAVIFLVSYWLQMRFIFPTLNHETYGIATVAHMHLWIFLRSTALLLALGYSVRCMSHHHLLFLQSIIALFWSGFSAAYQGSAVGFLSMRWFEAAWAAALSMLLLVAWSPVRRHDSLFARPAKLAPWYSLRCTLGLSVFAATALVIAGIALLDMFAIGHALSLSILLLLMFGAWTAANAVAFRLSSRLTAAMLDPLSRPKAGPQALPLLAEFEQVMGKYISASRAAADFSGQAARAAGEAELGRLTAQVAHDIRSPVAALRMVLEGLDQVPADIRELAQAATQRVEDIANSLLSCSKNSLSPRLTPFVLAPEIEKMVAEKRTLYSLYKGGVDLNVCFGDGTLSAFVLGDRARLVAALSNIVNNAIEALNGTGLVTINLTLSEQRLLCEVVDNGAGIPPHILAKLGQRGATFGKANGNGLGIYGARTTMEESGGSLDISSVVGSGTTVSLGFPPCPAA